MKNVDLGHLMRGEGGQQKMTVLFTFENVENVGRSLTAFTLVPLSHIYGPFLDFSLS